MKRKGGQRVDKLRHPRPEKVHHEQREPQISKIARRSGFHEEHFVQARRLSLLQLTTGFIEPHGNHWREKDKPAGKHHQPACLTGKQNTERENGAHRRKPNPVDQRRAHNFLEIR